MHYVCIHTHIHTHLLSYAKDKTSYLTTGTGLIPSLIIIQLANTHIYTHAYIHACIHTYITYIHIYLLTFTEDRTSFFYNRNRIDPIIYYHSTYTYTQKDTRKGGNTIIHTYVYGYIHMYIHTHTRRGEC